MMILQISLMDICVKQEQKALFSWKGSGLTHCSLLFMVSITSKNVGSQPVHNGFSVFPGVLEPYHLKQIN